VLKLEDGHKCDHRKILLKKMRELGVGLSAADLEQYSNELLMSLAKNNFLLESLIDEVFPSPDQKHPKIVVLQFDRNSS
jgi:hypothetical protein